MMAAVALMRYRVILATLAVLQVKGFGIEMDLLRVECDVEHRYAVTHITAAVTNKRNTSQELPLKMTLPKNAYVSSLVMEVGGRNFSTVVTEKLRNRRKGPTPDRTDSNRNRKRKENTQMFRASAKARGLQTVTFYLIYEELLQRTKGAYTHTLYLGAAKKLGVVEVSVRVAETEAIQDLQIVRLPWSSFMGPAEENSQVKQEIKGPGDITLTFRRENVTTVSKKNNTESNDDGGNEDDNDGIFSFSYDIDRQADGGEIQVLGRFFVHYFSPEGLPKLPTHTVFVLDVSGSMHDNGKLHQLKMAMRAILTDLQPEDSFEILVFSTKVTSLGVFQAVPNEIDRSVSRIQRLRALGGTNFNDALLKALQDINSFNLTLGAKQVVFLTDGQPNLGEKKPNQLRRNIREANIHHHPIYSLGFGQDADMRLLRQVSSDNRGFTRKIDETVRPADQLKGFYEEISSPLMTDVDVMYLEDEVDPNSVVRQGPSTFYAGDEMVLAGQLREGVTEVQPIVTGHGSSGPLQFRVSRISTPESSHERDNYVERLWAYLTVQDLLDMQEVVEDRNLRVEMNARALEIALRFHFVTELTSLDLEEPTFSQNGENHTYKSASRHQKSNTGTLKLLHEDLTLLSEAEFAKTLPAPLSTRLNTASNNRFSFGDNDPHFVVQVSGMEMPLCFDIHGQHGQVLSLVRDHNSGIVVNGQVTSAVGRPEATYFTQLFIGLGNVNFTITPHNITISSLDGHRNSKVARVLRSVWPFKKMYRRGGGRGGKSRQHSSRKSTRERRATDTNQVKGHSQPAHDRSLNQLRSHSRSRFQSRVPLLSKNYKRRHIPGISHIHNQNRSQINTPNHFIHNVNARFQTRFHNLGRKQYWNYSRKSTGIHNDAERHRSASIQTHGPVYNYASSYSRAHTIMNPVVYNQESIHLLNTKNTPLRIGTPDPLQDRNNVLSTLDTRTLMNVHEINLERKKRQRRQSRIRKRGKTRYKRNAILMKIENLFHPHALKYQQVHKNRKINTDSMHTHAARHLVHSHPSVGHRSHRGDRHSQVVRHQAPRAHTKNNKHRDVQSNPLAIGTYQAQTYINENHGDFISGSNYKYSETTTTTENPIVEKLNENARTKSTKNHPQEDAARNLTNTSTFRDHLHSTRKSPLETTQEYRMMLDTEEPPPSLADRRFIHPHSNKNYSHFRPLRHHESRHSIRNEPSTMTTRGPANSHETRNHTRPARNHIHPQAHRHSQNTREERFNVRDQSRSPATTRPARKPLDLNAVIQSHESNIQIHSGQESTNPISPVEKNSASEFDVNQYHPQSTVFSETQRLSIFDKKSHRIIADNRFTDHPVAERKNENLPQAPNNSCADHAHRKHSKAHLQHTFAIREPTHIHPGHEGSLRRKSTKTFTWRRAAGRRYGEVVVALRNRKKLDLMIGDVEAHFVITRSKTKYGQEFLGFYVEEHNILSPNTTGIIGQFAYKTVGTLTFESPAGGGENNIGMKLAVLQPEANRQYRVSEVSGMVSKRRSILHNSHVRCLLIPHQGRGLIAGTPQDYLLPCLTC